MMIQLKKHFLLLYLVTGGFFSGKNAGAGPGSESATPFSKSKLMEDSKLARLFRTLRKEEVERLDAYLRAFHSGRKVPLALFAHLKALHPRLKGKRMQKQYINDEVLGLPPSPDGKRIANEASKLYGWALDFLAWEKFRANEEEYQLALMELFKERRLEKDFLSTFKKAWRKIKAQPQSMWQALMAMRLYHSRYYHSPTEKLEADEPSIAYAARYLQQFYQLGRERYLCEEQSRHSILNTSPEAEAEEVVVGKELLELYRQASRLISRNEATVFQSLKEQLFEYGHLISDEDALILLSYLVNFVAAMLRKGQNHWLGEAFEIYQYEIDRELLLVDGYVTTSKFHNYVQVACELGKVKEAAGFVDKYAPLVFEPARFSAAQLARARIAFQKGAFEETISLLQDVEFRDDAYTLLSKLLQVRSYYECREDYSLALPSFIKSFREYLSRNNNLNANTLAGYRNFLNALNMMIAQRKRSPEEILRWANAQDAIVCKPWLERKLQSLPE